MASLLLVLVAVAVAGTQALAGGRHLALSLPGYGLLALAALLSWWPVRRTPVPRAVAECIATGAILLAYVVVRALFSPEEYLARQDLYLALGTAMLYLLVALNLTSSRLRGIFVAGLLGLAIANCVIGAIQFAGGRNFMVFDFLPRGDYGVRASGFYGYPNHLAVFLEVSLLMGLAMACWSRWAKWAKIVAGYASVVCLLGLLATGSRGGYFGGLAGLLVFGLLSLRMVGKLVPTRAIVLIAAGSVVVLFLGWGVQHLVKQSSALHSRASTMATVDTIRLRMWQAAWEQFKLHPVTGTGSGTYLYYGRQFRERAIQRDPTHAHNEYLELLAEYGIIGIALAMMFLDTHLRAGWKVFSSGVSRHSESLAIGSNSLSLTIGALSAAAACIVHSMMDFTLHMPANMLVMAFVFGVLANLGRMPDTANEPGLSPGLRLGLPVLGLLVALRALPTLPAEYCGELARVSLRDPQFIMSPEVAGAVETSARRGLAWDARNPELYFYIGRARDALALQADEEAAKKEHRVQSLDAYRRALELAPQDVRLVLLVGEALDALGRFDESAGLFDRALQLDPKSGTVLVAYATHLHAQGLLTEAAGQYRRAYELGVGPAAKMGLDRVTEEIKQTRKTAPPAPVNP